jgi:predicted alpha/beta-hydrolase family hydrolase
MIRRLLVHPDHASQQLVRATVVAVAVIAIDCADCSLVLGGTCVQGLREELEAASAVVAKLHARIARVTSFVRFMVRTIPPA